MIFIYVSVRVNFSDRFLPDKAIDLIDEAGSHVQLCHAKVKNGN
jgi:ATP-dependent Clp protease ATP-binding subunit ClpA